MPDNNNAKNSEPKADNFDKEKEEAKKAEQQNKTAAGNSSAGEEQEILKSKRKQINKPVITKNPQIKSKYQGLKFGEQ